MNTYGILELCDTYRLKKRKLNKKFLSNTLLNIKESKDKFIFGVKHGMNEYLGKA